MGGGFTVEPDVLRRLAGEFDALAERLRQAADCFATTAQPPADVFGALPQARAAHQGYVTTAQAGLDGLRNVHGAFRDSLATGLRTVASNYLRTDEGSAAG